MWSRTPLLAGCCRRAETAGLYGTAHGTTLAVGLGAMRDSLFSLVSFEGTDPYSQAGGLGVRVSGLARTLAELRYETHLFFIGDPHRPAARPRRQPAPAAPSPGSRCVAALLFYPDPLVPL